MATIKNCTDLPQSKKLAEFLPIESADMHYATWTILDGEFMVSPNQGSTIEDLQEDYGNQIIPCWSLAALLDVVSEEVSLNSFKNGNWNAMVRQNGKMIFSDANNPVDACVAMIEKLHEQKIL